MLIYGKTLDFYHQKHLPWEIKSVPSFRWGNRLPAEPWLESEIPDYSLYYSLHSTLFHFSHAKLRDTPNQVVSNCWALWSLDDCRWFHVFCKTKWILFQHTPPKFLISLTFSKQLQLCYLKKKKKEHTLQNLLFTCFIWQARSPIFIGSHMLLCVSHVVCVKRILKESGNQRNWHKIHTRY